MVVEGTTMFQSGFLYEAITLYVVLDPIAAIPIFLAVSKGLDNRQRLQVAAYAVAVAFAIFLFFIGIGHQLLNALHIPMASFQLAGSIVLLIFGLQMVLGKVSEPDVPAEDGHSLLQRAIFPLAMPCIAGSGSIMTVMMLTDNVARTSAENLQTILVLCLCLSILFVALALASSLAKLLGRSGIEVITRVFGLILTSIAVTNIIIAIKLSFGLATAA